MCDFQIDKDNFEQQQALDLITNTDTSLFITGKAGTGKTTFIKNILKDVDKNFLVLAPTGIAALAVGGQTIHSFFGFPCEVIGSTTQTEMSLAKRNLLKRTDTIIVDEASMVRADLVDGTPILDIKPYLAYADAHPEARSGFAQIPPQPELKVVDDHGWLLLLPDDKRQVLSEALAHDPRPHYQHDASRVYAFPFDKWEVRFRVGDKAVEIVSVERSVK